MHVSLPTIDLIKGRFAQGREVALRLPLNMCLGGRYKTQVTGQGWVRVRVLKLGFCNL